MSNYLRTHELWPASIYEPIKNLIQKIQVQDYSGGPVVKNPPSNARVASLIPRWVTKISHASRQLSLCTIPREEAYVPQMKSLCIAAKTQCSPPQKTKTHTQVQLVTAKMIYVTQNQVQMEWKQSKINTLH